MYLLLLLLLSSMYNVYVSLSSFWSTIVSVVLCLKSYLMICFSFSHEDLLIGGCHMWKCLSFCRKALSHTNRALMRTIGLVSFIFPLCYKQNVHSLKNSPIAIWIDVLKLWTLVALNLSWEQVWGVSPWLSVSFIETHRWLKSTV